MNWKRVLLGKITLYIDKNQKWNCLFYGEYWSGRLFILNISKLTVTLDCRINLIKDMITGVAE